MDISKVLELGWFSDPETYFREKTEELPIKAEGFRRAEHSDLPNLERLISAKTTDIFGTVDLPRIFEMSCLTIVQYDKKHEIISGMFLCNFPNVPSIIPDDWLHWVNTLYGIDNATESNTLFVHFLAWKDRYIGSLFEELLTGLFDMATDCHCVILPLPPRVAPDDVIETQMTRVFSKDFQNQDSVQSIYLYAPYSESLGLKIRRVVEEDNDDVIPIIDAEASQLKELYGEYYISEITRHPDDRRQLIATEDEDGLATGMMVLNSNVNVDILNECFELRPYNGFRKPHENDHFPSGSLKAASEIFFSIFQGETLQYVSSGTWLDDGMSSFEERVEMAGVSSERLIPSGSKIECQELETVKVSQSQFVERTVSASMSTFLSEQLPSLSDYIGMYYQSKIRQSVFAETLLDVPRRSSVLSEGDRYSVSEDFDVSPSIYRGLNNVFVIEILATPKELKKRSYWHFLEAAFESFPDLDYCAILLPSSHPFFSFLLNFVRVPLKCNNDFPMSLYVTHRATLLGKVRSRKGETRDLESLQNLSRGIPKMGKITVDFQEALKNQSNSVCIVFECDGIMVGVAILCTEKYPGFIKRRYHVEDYIAAKNIPHDSYGRIMHFIIMPIFGIYYNFFLREIMRLTGFMVLYYRIYQSDISALTRTRPLASCFTSMMPINPRRRIDYQYYGFIETDIPGTEVEPEGKDEEKFALFMTTPRLTMIPSSFVDAKIVVIGASNCGLAFLEHLLLGSAQSFTRFTSLTIISPHGLPFENKRSHVVSSMIPFRGRYCRDYRHLIAIRASVNVIYGKVMKMNRKNKYVTVMNQGNLTYDYLVLACGLQYQRPIFQDDIETEKRGLPVNKELPWNCLSANDDTEAAMCLEKIRILTNNLQTERSIIIYGQNIDCYCALYGLIEFGVRPSWITLIEPPLNQCETHDAAFFGDCEVDTEIMKSILQSGVNVLIGLSLFRWNLRDSEKGKMIESIVFEEKGERKTIACGGFFNFFEKTVDSKIFLAICRAGLVFDGQVIIDPECRTTDPFIFAAGTIAKYSRKFLAESWEHKYYNRVEVGERLAQILSNAIETDYENAENQVAPSKKKHFMTFPMFRAPTILACILPGGHRYLHVRKPGRMVQRKIAIRHNFYGEVLITGSCSSEIGYFRIRLNSCDSVESTTCLSKKDFEVEHIISLYGKHEKILNELKHRFKSSLISDFYFYFREPWAAAIFYDRFECLRLENRATLLSRLNGRTDSLVDDCIKVLAKSKWDAISEKDRLHIQSKFAGSIYQQELEENLLDFLQFSEEDLPMYCTPRKLRDMYSDIEDSPLFFEL